MTAPTVISFVLLVGIHIGGADILVCHRTRYAAADILTLFRTNEYIDPR
jgi:hypothetical protein